MPKNTEKTALSTPSDNGWTEQFSATIAKCGEEKDKAQAGGKRKKPSKKASKKPSKKASKKASNKPSKKASKKPSKRKLSRDGMNNPIMIAFAALRKHIGAEISKIGGNAGPVASIVSSMYVSKALGGKSKDEVDKIEIYKKARALFDADSEASRRKVLKEAQDKPRKPKKSKKTAE